MILDQIKSLLKARTGIHIDTVGDSILNSAIQTRLRALGITDMVSYFTLLQKSNDELTELTEEVVIPETWFFRDHHPFDMLGKLAAKAISENSGAYWRILSVPSSTGEEPYSIAMTLLMAGMNPSQFCIEAIDISHRALERAKAGRYGQHSFRGMQDTRVRERYFDKADNEYILKQEVRELVQFEQANLLDSRFQDRPAYDLIFCRNLLIYFDTDGKKTAYDTLYRLLTNNGILFIGHSESGAIPSCFTHTRDAHAFAYRKNMENSKTPAATVSSMARKKIKQTTRPSLSEHSSPSTTVTNERPKTGNSNPGPGIKIKQEPDHEIDTESPIELARKYADAGNLVDAEHICQIYLNNNGQDASAHYLLGLILEASNHTEKAEKSYRKALYLDPHYKDALIQLALLLDKRGKSQQAQQLRKRANKLQEQTA